MKSSENNNSQSKDNSTDPTYSSDKSGNSNSSNIDTGDNGSQSNGKSSAEVAITSASIQGDSLEVRAFAANVIEGGSCTALVENGAKNISGTSDAFIDASTTPCEPIEIPLSKLGAGTWSVTVIYESKNHKGVSTPTEVKL